MTEMITDAVLTGNRYDITEILEEQLAKKQNPIACLDAMIAGLDETGRRFEIGDFFVPELMMSAETFKEGMDLLAPHLSEGDREYLGTVVLGTVQGDVHDIGMNLVGFMLESSGFEVINLGTNVSAESFIDAVKTHSADVLALSALLTTTMLSMEGVVNTLVEKNLRSKVKVIVGGAPVSQKYADDIGADAYAFDAVAGVNKIKELVAK